MEKLALQKMGEVMFEAMLMLAILTIAGLMVGIAIKSLTQGDE